MRELSSCKQVDASESEHIETGNVSEMLNKVLVCVVDSDR